MDADQREDSWWRESWLGPGLVAVGLILVAGYLLARLVLQLVTPDFAEDHGVAGAPGWVRCAAETIERHPAPFGASSGFEIDRESPRFVTVRTALITTRVQVAEGSLVYHRGRGSHLVTLDCPSDSPSG